MSATVQSAIFAESVKPIKKLEPTAVRMTADAGNLTLYAYGVGHDITVSAPALVDESFEVTLAPTMLANCAAVALGVGKLKFSLKDSVVSVEGDGMNAELRTLDPFGNYLWPMVEGHEYGGDLMDKIERVSYAAAGANTKRDNLKGVFIMPDRIVATDSFRLHQFSVAGIKGETAMVPLVALPILALVDEPETVYVTPRWIRVSGGHRTVTAALSESTGPSGANLDLLLAQAQSDVGVNFPMERIKAFRALMATASDEQRRIEFRVADGLLVASVIEREQRYEVELDVTIVGEPELPYIVSGPRFAALIEAAGGDTVELRWQTKAKPSIVNKEGEVILMMPIIG
jgi:DNA polymerase III sliding clamp (beta) subunit (PCNA family)